MNRTKTKLRLTRTEEETIDGILRNNDQVLWSLYKEVYPKVRRYISKNNGAEEQAKDIFQDAFIATWKNIKQGKLNDKRALNVEAYLFTIAKNKWLDYLRSSTYKKTVKSEKLIELVSLSAEDENEAKSLESQLSMDAMQQAFKKLGENCKIVLKLFYFERKSMDEISIELKIASASARNQKYRCMEKLRSMTLDLKNNG